MSTTETPEAAVLPEPRTAIEMLILVMQEVEFVAKTRQTTAQGQYMFRGIDEVINAVGPAMRKHGGLFVPTLLEKTHETQPTAAGGSVNLVRVTVRFAAYGQVGEPIVGECPGEAFDSGDKATAKAMSVAFRTFLLQTLAIPTNEPDPDESGFERGDGKDKPIYFDIGRALLSEFRDRDKRVEFVEAALGRSLDGGIESLAVWDIEDLERYLEAYKRARIEGRPMRDAKDFLARLKADEAAAGQ